ncbi:MAG: SDR family oxidoreductase [Deltaproteobacteria bacterium]|nr:SDR family oxidoreductase [Deltaproteobacteria bacterium]
MSRTPSHLFVTGAASGIGRHLVGAFARRGVRVDAADLTMDRLTLAAREDGWPDTVALHAFDVRDPHGWDAAFAAAERDPHHPVDALVNCAAMLTPDWFGAVTDLDIDRHFDVNVKGVAYGMRAALNLMQPRGRGHIVNFGSLASLSPVPGLALYSASKFAVRGLSLSVALEVAKDGIAVTVVMPDAVETPMLDLQKSRPEAALTFSGASPLRPAELVAALDEVFATRPLELALPANRGRLARLVSAFPELGKRIAPLIRKVGLRNQARAQR